MIPGAWLGSWVWSKTVPLLRSKGMDAHPVTLTGMGDRVHLASENIGIQTAIQDVLNIIEYNDLDEILLVGHSFAGKVAAAVGDRIPDRIKMVLYLDSFWPKKTDEPQGDFQPDEFGKLEPGQLTLPFSEEILESIGSDVVGSDRDWMLSKATPWILKMAMEPIKLSGNVFTLKSAHIFCTKGSDAGYIDEVTSGKWGELLGPYRIIDSGHFPMVTMPQILVDTMLTLLEESS